VPPETTRTVRSLGVERPGAWYFASYEEGPPPDGCFRVETLYSGLSAGTELTFAKGTNPYLHSRWDEDLGVFVPGEPGAGYPVSFLGYMEVGRVLDSRTPAARDGEVVGMTYGHKSGHTADPRQELALTLPPEVDPILGIYAAQMGPICANGLLHAAADLVGADVRSLGDGVRGRNLLVVGAGVVGLLTALFARRHGAAEILVADPSSYRRGIAQALGFPTADEPDASRLCKERWGHGGSDRGADVAFQCRAHSASLHEALRALRPQGTVVDLAFYQGGAADLRLGEEFHHNGLAIRCAQIGRVPRGLAFAWDRRRLAMETLGLLRAEGVAIREHMITHVVPIDDAPAFLADLSANRRDFLQVVLRFGPT
jgi:NADPH:quinone reductase-like Zn-dependent oxidoreductase